MCVCVCVGGGGVVGWVGVWGGGGGGECTIRSIFKDLANKYS